MVCLGGWPSGRGLSWPARRVCRTRSVAQRFSVSVPTVGKWRSRFAADRLAGLQDEQRAGRPKAELVLTEAERAELNRWARRAKSAQVLGDAGPDRAGLR